VRNGLFEAGGAGFGRGQPGVRIETEILPTPPRSDEVRFTIKR